MNTINRLNQIDKPQIHSLIEGGSNLSKDEIAQKKLQKEAEYRTKNKIMATRT